MREKHYGPGASYYTWLAYFPKVHLYFVEYDEECADKFASKVDKALIYAGDAANGTFLELFADQTTVHGNFDVIIDNGGGDPTQQKTSLEHLWRIVNPGGLYFLEDIHHVGSSGHPDRGDNSSEANRAENTTLTYIHELIDDFMTGSHAHSISSDIRSIECMSEICAIVKKEEGSK
jgi:predicted O-methyltransferase YrrM